MSVERWANCQKKEFAHRSKRSLNLKERAFWAVRSLSDAAMLSFWLHGFFFFTIVNNNTLHRVGRVLSFLQSSELGLPQPLTRRRLRPPRQWKKAKSYCFSVNLTIFSVPIWTILRSIRNMQENSKFKLRSLLTLWFRGEGHTRWQVRGC